MKLLPWSELNEVQREQVRYMFAWLADLYKAPDTEAWLAEHAYWFCKDGRLAERRHEVRLTAVPPRVRQLLRRKGT